MHFQVSTRTGYHAKAAFANDFDKIEVRKRDRMVVSIQLARQLTTGTVRPTASIVRLWLRRTQLCWHPCFTYVPVTSTPTNDASDQYITIIIITSSSSPSHTSFTLPTFYPSLPTFYPSTDYSYSSLINKWWPSHPFTSFLSFSLFYNKTYDLSVQRHSYIYIYTYIYIQLFLEGCRLLLQRENGNFYTWIAYLCHHIHKMQTFKNSPLFWDILSIHTILAHKNSFQFVVHRTHIIEKTNKCMLYNIKTMRTTYRRQDMAKTGSEVFHR